MKTSQRRGVLGVAILAAALVAGYAYYLSLVPATHPDHGHGHLDLGAGGRLLVTARDGKARNLVGAPGHPLGLHFFAPTTDGAADELASLFAFQKQTPPDANVEFVILAR